MSAQVAGFYRDLNPGGGTGSYSAQLTNGNVNLDGSLSQQTDKNGPKTGGTFNKIRLNGTWQQALSTQTSVFTSYTGQLADKNLDSSEIELRHQLESGINLSTFYDWGQVWIQHDPNFPGGPVHNQNTYKGFGASMGYTTSDGVNIKATWARKSGQNPNPTQTGNDQDGTRDRNRYWL